jgi:dipeptidyl-peptidase 4
MRFTHRTWVWLGLLICTPAGAASHLPPELESRLQAIYDKHEFDVKSFGPAKWFDRGAGYTLLEAAPSGQSKDLVRYGSVDGKREVLVSASQLKDPDTSTPLAPDDYTLSPNAVRVLFTANARVNDSGNDVGDYWLFDRQSASLSRVAVDVEEPDREGVFSPDGLRIFYVRVHNLYVHDLQTGKSTALTSDGVVGAIGNGICDGGDSGIVRWSPDGTQIAYVRCDSSNVGLFPLLDNTKDVYPKPHFIRYPKVGTPIPAQRLGVASVSGGPTPWPTRWIDLAAEPGSYYLETVDWSGKPNDLVAQKLARSKDTLDVFLVDPRTSEARVVHHEQDSAWVKDSGFATDPGFEWLQQGRAFTWLSEKDGWRRAYALSRDGKREIPLTPARVDVISSVKADQKHGWLYYIASPDNATQRYLYRSRLDGTGRVERVTPANQRGTHTYDVSPDGRWAFHTSSTADSPPVTELIELPQHRMVRVLEDNAALREKLASWGPRPTEFFKLDIGGGTVMDAWMLKPRDFDPSKKYPVFIFIYGEPAGQTVLDSWSMGQRLGLYHRALADAGYLVVSMDNRGTPAPKGSAWRRAVFGSLGPLSTEEQAAGLRELGRTRSYVDLSRVGIWGWSAGGTNTLNALFRKPEQYHVGIAVAPKPRQISTMRGFRKPTCARQP